MAVVLTDILSAFAELAAHPRRLQAARLSVIAPFDGHDASSWRDIAALAIREAMRLRTEGA